MTAPTTEPLTLAEAKTHLRITVPDHDAILAGYILGARRYAENYIRGALVTQTWDYTIDFGWPMVFRDGNVRTRIELPLHPVQSVTSISYVDEAGASQTLSAALYVLHKDRSVPFIEKAFDASFPNVRCVPAAVTVRFVCGYAPESVPDDIRAALMLHVEQLYDGEKSQFATVGSPLERARDALLDPYRIVQVA